MTKPLAKLSDKESRRRLPPGGGGDHYYTGRDRQRLRYGLWLPEQVTGGTVFILPGRSEFIEKYFETIADLRDRGFVALILDWRGQGLSGRLIIDTPKSKGDEFDLMIGDLTDLISLAKRKKLPKPWTVLGHSMGCHLFLRLIHDKPRQQKNFDRAVLIAPMMGLKLSGATLSLLKYLIKWARKRKKLKNLAPFQGNKNIQWKKRLGFGRLTSDAGRFQDEHWQIDQNPALAVGGITYGWLDAAFNSMKLLQRSRLPEKLKIPICFVLPGKENVVDAKASRDFIARIPDATVVILKDARHEILKERDDIRKTFWKIFENFV